MSSEARRGLRIALAFTAAFVLAELLRLDLQLTFLAPLVAGTLASGPAAGLNKLVALPVLAWLLVAVAGLALQFLAEQPPVLCLLGLWIFYGAFKMFEDPHKAILGLLILIVFAIVPLTLIKAPEASSDLAYWFGLNFIIAVASEWTTRRLLPEQQLEPLAPPAPQLPPLLAALALLLAVILTASMRPPAPGAVLIGVVIALRADGETAANVIRDRFVAALLGGVAAVVVWEVLWLAPTILVLATVILFAAWLFTSRIAAGGPGIGIAMKSLNVLAILVGEGFSVFYQDADDRIWTRFAGVVLGLAYAATVLALTRRFATPRYGAPAVHGTAP
ncbi:MAG TPA: hypothetical protein VHU15_04315 [Stellaceae bacterium]|jgi:hypothetical protein|nr:hypothetical protein [Stellaceae bacterium]